MENGFKPKAELFSVEIYGRMLLFRKVGWEFVKFLKINV